jgi:hypothetical protein
MQNEEKKCPSSLRESIHFLSLSLKSGETKAVVSKAKPFVVEKARNKHTERRTGVSVFVILCSSFVKAF